VLATGRHLRHVSPGFLYEEATGPLLAVLFALAYDSFHREEVRA
jgi:hypothetical protein